MSNQHKEKAADKGGSSNMIVAIVIIVLLVNGALLLKYGVSPKPADKTSTAENPKPASTNAASSTTSTNTADFARLLGKWVRPDGGYVIEIRDIDAQGRMKAGYFNPRPINVSIANVKMEGSYTKVFVELRDENYPGSTYNLIYVEDKDLLVGMYFQAAQNQSFEVEFERLKPE